MQILKLNCLKMILELINYNLICNPTKIFIGYIKKLSIYKCSVFKIEFYKLNFEQDGNSLYSKDSSFPPH